MKKLPGFIALIFIALTVASGCTPAADPVSVVESWCQAYAAQDAEAMVNYELTSLGDATPAERIAGYNDGFALFDSISLTDVNITVRSQQETTATVAYTCVEVMVWAIDGTEYAEATTTVFNLTNSSGTWLISNWNIE